MSNTVEAEIIYLRMTDDYGVANNYRVKNECPYDGSKLTKSSPRNGCYDGDWTFVDTFSCENGCTIQYKDMRKHNGYHND